MSFEELFIDNVMQILAGVQRNKAMGGIAYLQTYDRDEAKERLLYLKNAAIPELKEFMSGLNYSMEIINDLILDEDGYGVKILFNSHGQARG